MKADDISINTSYYVFDYLRDNHYYLLDLKLQLPCKLLISLNFTDTLLISIMDGNIKKFIVCSSLSVDL